jgi:hypothetical protein
MAHTHEYDCIVCGAHFDSQKDLHVHNQDKHVRTASGMEKPRAQADGSPDDKREEPPGDREL